VPSGNVDLLLNAAMSGQEARRVPVPWPAMAGVGELFRTIAVTAVLCIPLGLSVWALLDCVRHPQWAWALAGRRQLVWLIAILFGLLCVAPGIVVSLVYLVRIRPIIAAAERGTLPE
jgi:hypothetical protein